jgi:hypothetical protein
MPNTYQSTSSEKGLGHPGEIVDTPVRNGLLANNG